MTTNKLGPMTTCGHLPHYCKELCRTCYQRAWRQANREKYRGRNAAYGKAWRVANSERRAAYQKTWEAAHPHYHVYKINATNASWRSMIQRCTNPNSGAWPWYGGHDDVAITVCDRWLHSFENFFADMGERPEGTTLGRFGDVGNYEPGNCAWMTRPEQEAEKRKKRRLIFAGESLSRKGD